MAVKSVCQILEDWEGSLELPYAEKFVVSWKVIADHDDGPLVVMDDCQNNFSLPATGDVYEAHNEVDSNAICTRVRARRAGSVGDSSASSGGDASLWRYTAEYGQRGGSNNQDPPPGDVLPGDKEEDPIARPEREWYEWEAGTEPFTRDANGLSVVNSAQEPFTDFTRDTANLVHVVMQRMDGNNATQREAIRAKLTALALKINSAPWRGHAAGTLLMRPPGCFGPRYENRKIYYEITYRAVVFDPNDINTAPTITPEDWGTQELVIVAAGYTQRRQVAITDGENTLDAPVKLDGLGRRKPDQTTAAVLCDGVAGRPGPYVRYGSVDFNTYINAPPP